MSESNLLPTQLILTVSPKSGSRWHQTPLYLLALSAICLFTIAPQCNPEVDFIGLKSMQIVKPGYNWDGISPDNLTAEQISYYGTISCDAAAAEPLLRLMVQSKITYFKTGAPRLILLETNNNDKIRLVSYPTGLVRPAGSRNFYQFPNDSTQKAWGDLVRSCFDEE